MSLSDSDFEILQKHVADESGIILDKQKMYLLESRLIPIAQRYNLNGLAELAGAVRIKQNPSLSFDVVDAMTTNETSFMRDMGPFDSFRDYILPYLKQMNAATKSIRIWCNACSTGQEPYSLSMIIKEKMMDFPGWRFEIIATDISKEALAKAQEGRYTQFEVQRGLPVQMMVKYFTQEETEWVIKDEIKQMVTFKEHNLLNDLSGYGIFDMIFCRNVLIYFNQELKSKILDSMADITNSHGFILLGGAETVIGLSEKWKPLQGVSSTYTSAASKISNKEDLKNFLAVVA